jgi:hypothetical protein
VVERALDVALELFGGIVVVHGGCPTGADLFADEWARRVGVRCEVWRAD